MSYQSKHCINSQRCYSGSIVHSRITYPAALAHCDKWPRLARTFRRRYRAERRPPVTMSASLIRQLPLDRTYQRKGTAFGGETLGRTSAREIINGTWRSRCCDTSAHCLLVLSCKSHKETYGMSRSDPRCRRPQLRSIGGCRYQGKGRRFDEVPGLLPCGSGWRLGWQQQAPQRSRR